MFTSKVLGIEAVRQSVEKGVDNVILSTTARTSITVTCLFFVDGKRTFDDRPSRVTVSTDKKLVPSNHVSSKKLKVIAWFLLFAFIHKPFDLVPIPEKCNLDESTTKRTNLSFDGKIHLRYTRKKRY